MTLRQANKTRMDFLPKSMGVTSNVRWNKDRNTQPMINEMLNATKEVSLQKFMIVSFVPHALKHKTKSDGVTPL